MMKKGSFSYVKQLPFKTTFKKVDQQEVHG